MKRRILVQFGNKVRERRTALGLSQEELAERAGVHRTYVGMVERAEKNVTLESIEKLANALDISVDRLLRLHT